jgi:hypothetical protein
MGGASRHPSLPQQILSFLSGINTMLHKTLYLPCVLLVSNIIWEITTFKTFITVAKAQSFEPPVNTPAPTTTIGGGRRGNDGQCLIDRDLQGDIKEKKNPIEQEITLLLPPNKFGLTISSHPQFFVYIPKTNAIAVEFTLENHQGKGIASKRLALTNTPSIVTVQFDQNPLEIGKDYKWLVSVVCETGDPEDLFSEGIIRRIKPEQNTLAKLGKATAIDKVYLYAKLGIWYEAIAELAALRLSQPNNTVLKTNWLNLLKSASLEHFAHIPLKL